MRDYPTKKEFITVLRQNGYAVRFISTEERFDDDCAKYYERIENAKTVRKYVRMAKEELKRESKTETPETIETVETVEETETVETKTVETATSLNFEECTASEIVERISYEDKAPRESTKTIKSGNMDS